MIFRITKYLLLIIAGLLIGALAILFTPPLYRHFITYPKIENQVTKFQKLRKEHLSVTPLKLYRGVMHVHSYLSHDSKGTLEDIISAAKSDGIDFIFLTDHPSGNIDTLPNTEEPHNWGNRWYQGMEIYNFHTDTKDEYIIPQIANFIINGRKYRQWSLREMFDEQTEILSRWDSLNTNRKIVGFSAVDTHENQNIRARYIKDGRIEWIGPDARVIDKIRYTFISLI